eukprot:CAMPEP_0194065618 /NCGR_PEP_ID=MMETSP0009_2-20130614/85569_1 /TAXON_ID=210454 /ORGANISM="Grammatophora oceanica, Strain CCMP 410" /LENGTH=124 /DNA_ID=CAMNT_0038718487 /DNA_START=516 /DNA_END=890 /DNA_ORIENTATION=-
MKTTLFLISLLLLFSAVLADYEDRERMYKEKMKDRGPSLEKIKSNVYRRRQKWVEMLDKHKDIVAKHESGEKVVEDQELDMSKKRIEQVERKIQRIDEMKEEDFLKEQRKAYGRWNERGIKDEL